MVCSPDKENQQPHESPWLRNKKALNNAFFAMRLDSLTPNNQIERVPLAAASQLANKTQDFTLTQLVSDKTSLLSDEILLKILSNLPKSQRNSNFLVSKRWLNLQGRLVRSIKVLDWDFLISGRLFFRFPNLIHVDLVNACLIYSPNNIVSTIHGGCDVGLKDWLFPESFVLNANEVDRGLGFLASGVSNLRKLVVANCSEMGLLSVAEECHTLQELELRMCNDRVLRGIAACQNLEILRLSGSLISDVGLTILAQGCKRLIKLELMSGCKGSYEGIKAIGQCCQMLEELTFSNHEMEDGWLMALSYYENLKTLRFLSCKRIDGGCEEEDLGCCIAVESLHLDKCQLRDKKSLRALFLMCQNARELVLKNCWGLTDDMFTTATAFGSVRSLCIEGCSLLTTQGLESVIISWKELKSLKVKSCNSIKNGEVNPGLSNVFAALKNLKWDPHTKSPLSANLAGTGMGKKGSKFFNKSSHWKSLHRELPSY